MCGNSVFCAAMHIVRSYLNLYSFSCWTNHRGVQRLIQIEFWHCNVILKTPWDRIPARVNRAKNCVAISNIVHQNSNSYKIIDVIELSSANHHFLVNAIQVFLTTRDGCLDALFCEVLFNDSDYIVCKLFSGGVSFNNQAFDFLVFFRFNVFKGKIL